MIGLPDKLYTLLESPRMHWLKSWDKKNNKYKNLRPRKHGMMTIYSFQLVIFTEIYFKNKEKHVELPCHI